MRKGIISTGLIRLFLLFSIISFFAVALHAVGPWGTDPNGMDDAKPPVDAIITGYSANGEVLEDIARFKITVSLRVFSDGWIDIPFLKNCSATEFSIKTGDDKKIFFASNSGGGYKLLCGKPGDYQIEVLVVSKVDSSGADRSVLIPYIPAVSGSVNIKIPEEVSDIETKTGVKFSRSIKKGTTEIVLYGGDLDDVKLSWKIRPGLTALQALVFVDQKVDAKVGRGVVNVSSTINYTVLQGTVDRLILSCPKGCNLLDVSGKEIKTWNLSEKTKSGAQELEVILAKPIRKKYVLKASLERPLDSIPCNANIPALKVLGVKREQGQISIYSQKGLKIEPGKVVGATQFDVHEEKKYRQTGKSGIGGNYKLGLAYKYLKRPFSVSVKTSLIKPKVTAEIESLMSVSRETVRSTNTIIYNIRDSGVFKWRFTLDPDCKLIDIKGQNINNWRIKDNLVEVDLRSAAEGSYRLSVELEKPLAGKKETILPGISLLDVTRHTGYIAVSPRLDTKVEPVSSSGVSQIDVKDLPLTLRSVKEGVSFAYRYIRHPYEIKISIGQVEPEVHSELFSRFTIKEKELHMDAQLNFDIRKAGIFELRIAFPENLRLVDTVYGDYIEDWRIDTEKHLLIISFRSKIDGKYVLNLSATSTLDKIKKGIKLPVLSIINAKKERGFISVRPETSIRIKTDKSKNVSEIDVDELPAYFKASGVKISMAYKYFRQPWDVSLVVEPILPVVTAEIFNLTALGDGLEQTSSKLDYLIQFAGIQKFQLRFPPGAKNINIIGKNIKHKEMGDKDNNLWTVELQAKVEGKYSLFVAFERKLEEKSDKVNYVGVKAVGVEREKGYIAIAPRGNVEIIPVEKLNKGVTPIDLTEIPQKFRKDITLSIVWVFKYISHPYSIGLEIVKHLDVEALVAVAEYACITTLVSKEGATLTQIDFTIKNTRKQFLRLLLPEKVKILDAFVDGRGVRLGQSKVEFNGKERYATLIPISVVGKPGIPFSVVIKYQDKSPKLDYFGHMNFSVLAVDIPVMRMDWKLKLPVEYRLNGYDGDFRRVDELSKNQVVSETTKNYSGQQWRQKKLNLTSNMIQSNLENLQVGQRDTQKIQNSVSKNIFDNINSNGITYFFEKLIAVMPSGNKEVEFISPGNLSINYIEESMNLITGGIVFIVILFLGIILKTLKNRIQKMIIPAALALVVMSYNLLRPDFYPTVAMIAISTLWLLSLLAVFGLFYSILKKMNQSIEEKREEKRKNKISTGLPKMKKTPSSLTLDEELEKIDETGDQGDEN